MYPRRAGFTLLEVCLALAIGLILIVMAVPSIVGLLAEQRLKESSERIDRLVARARQLSVRDQRTYALVWERNAIRLISRGGAAGRNSEPEAGDVLAFAKGENFTLNRTAALDKNPAPIWTFWPNGLCEPAIVGYEGAAGKWSLKFDPLTAHGEFLSSEVR